MSIFAYLTPAIYLLLILLWSVVAVFYARRRQRARREGDRLLQILLLVLLLDAVRTIFESIFFGAWFGAKVGFLPQGLYDFLVQPQVVFIPKAVNLLIGMAVPLIILRLWLPQEARQKAAQLVRQSELEDAVRVRGASLLEVGRQLEEDIQQRVAAEKQLSRRELELQRARRTFETLFESIPDALVLADTERRIMAVNLGFTQLFGYTAEEVIGQHTSVIYKSQEEFERQGRVRFNLSAERKREPYIVSYRSKDGAIVPGETTGTLVLDDAGELLGFFGLIRDVSKRERQEELSRQTQKLEALGTLAGGIAHDFNNILAAIMGFAALADEEAEPGSEVKADLEEILRAATRGEELVSQILTFSREEEVTRELIPMHEVVSEAFGLLRHTLPTTIEIEQDLQDSDDLVCANTTQIHQICLNLGTNAYHAMRRAGGKLSVTLASVEIDLARATTLGGLSPGPHLKLAVEDTGAGMAPETVGKIFEPFFTTKPIGEGTGMGLAVVHGIVSSHGGAVHVDSRLGEGTRIEIYLPKGDESARESARVSTAAPRRPRVAARILVVDDEPALTRVLARVFRKLGHWPVTETSSKRALERFRTDPSAFDLVVTDQTMPELTGTDLIRELLALRPGLPVILCTGHSEFLDEARAIELGAKGLLGKPFDIDKLEGRVQRLLDEAREIVELDE